MEQMPVLSPDRHTLTQAEARVSHGAQVAVVQACGPWMYSTYSKYLQHVLYRIQVVPVRRSSVGKHRPRASNRRAGRVGRQAIRSGQARRRRHDAAVADDADVAHAAHVARVADVAHRAGLCW